jgi:hypothetical protein
MTKTILLACAFGVLSAISLPADPSHSAPLAKELAGVLLEKKLDAIAAADPDDSHRSRTRQPRQFRVAAWISRPSRSPA